MTPTKGHVCCRSRNELSMARQFGTQRAYVVGFFTVLQEILDRLASFRRGVGYRKAFLSKRQFERTVSRERIRASRRGIPFCVVTFRPARSGGTSAKVAKLLLRNLRVTDEKAFFANGELAALLVDTTQLGGRAVIDRLSLLFDDNGLDVMMELQVHNPSPEDFIDPNGSAGDHSSSQMRRQDRTIAIGAGGGIARETWDESASWQSSPAVKTDRRSLQLDPRQDPISQRANEIVSTDDRMLHTRTLSAVVKRVVDVVASAIGLILVGPLLLFAMAAIQLTSPGSPVFCQTREGRRGKPFTIFKLRTMVVGAEKSQQALRELSHRDGPAFKIKSDPRVTKIGRFLRATCFDELPQLLNVLLGDMSIVGPRPLPWHESRACKHWQRRRLDVRPGLTCFWQIDKASVETFEDWMRLDLAYVDRRSLWVDFVLIYRTMAVALLGRGGH